MTEAGTIHAPAPPAVGVVPEPGQHPAAPLRRRMPARRESRTRSFTVGGVEGYLTAGMHPDGTLGEVFLILGKQGSTLAGLTDGFSVAVSVALQYGVPLERLLTEYANTRFEPSGITDDPDIRIATSPMDYVVRRLALDFLPYEMRAALGLLSSDERAHQLDAAPGVAPELIAAG